MVKFGVHVAAFLAENESSNLYVVPYRKIRDSLVETEAASPDLFCKEWKESLQKAVQDFDQAMVSLWQMVFEGISESDSSLRGATPDTAFGLFLSSASTEASHELLSKVKYMCETSLTNAEALRKLVKKYDKQHHDKLSLQLLPQLYAANFCVGQPTLEDGLVILREALHTDYDEDEPHQMHVEHSHFQNSRRRGKQHDDAVKRRREELAWLKELVASIAPSEIAHIVAHRGFHNPLDRSDKRPLENSLAAYEAAWTNGIHLCECDVALTKDEKLVLCHDDDFSRLALIEEHGSAHRKVRDLTFRELMALPLKSGIRPPLLIDVLRSARAIGGHSKLIIEIKPGNNAAAKELARLFIRHPDLMEQCAVIMSFDLFAMHTLRTDLAILEPSSASNGGAIRKTHRSNMSLTNLAISLSDAAINEGFIPLGPRRDSNDHFGVGLTLSGRSDSFSRKDDNSVPLGSSPNLRNGMPPSSSALYTLDETRRIPQLMLLTVADQPKIPAELQVGVFELENVEPWLHRDDGALDGVYLQYEKEMLSRQGTEALQKLASKYSVGVWGFAHKDPDDYETFHHLVREGNVRFVNSDLPKAFKKKAHLPPRRGMSVGPF